MAYMVPFFVEGTPNLVARPYSSTEGRTRMPGNTAVGDDRMIDGNVEVPGLRGEA